MAVEYLASSSESHSAINTRLWTDADLPVTIVFWFRLDTLNDTDVMWGHANTGGGYIESAFLGTIDNKISFQYQSGPNYNTSNSTSPITSIGWHTGVFVQVATNNSTMYIDGERGTNGLANVNMPAGGVWNMMIGSYDRGGGHEAPFTGGMAYFAIYVGYAWTQADADAFNAGQHPLSIHPEYLAYFWELQGNGPVEVRVRDIIGNINLDTVTGTPTKTDSPKLRVPRFF